MYTKHSLRSQLAMSISLFADQEDVTSYKHSNEGFIWNLCLAVCAGVNSNAMVSAFEC